jgi:Flp pilus assembly protein TadG
VPSKPQHRSRRRPRSRGQALVEFALVIPVFLMVLTGTLDFGFLLYSRMTVINSAREGARAAVTAPDPRNTLSVATGAAQGVAAGIGTLTVFADCIPLAPKVSCDWTTTTSSAAGDSVKVTVRYQYHPFFPLLIGTNINLDSTVQMVRE